MEGLDAAGDDIHEKPDPKYRPTKDRPALDFRLIEWLQREHENDPLRSVRPLHLILSHSQRLHLVRAHPNKVKSVSDVLILLDKTSGSDWAEEWSLKVFNVICAYEHDLATLAEQNRIRKRKRT